MPAHVYPRVFKPLNHEYTRRAIVCRTSGGLLTSYYQNAKAKCLERESHADKGVEKGLLIEVFADSETQEDRDLYAWAINRPV